LNNPQASRYWQNIEGTVRDRLWVFCCPPNTDFGTVGRRSVMTAAEAAFYLDVPNVIMVQASSGEAQYGRFDPPFDPYALALRPMKRVAWSIVGSGGFTTPAESRQVMDLAQRTDNITAIMLDDFFTGEGEGKRAHMTVDELRAVRREIESAGKPLDLLVTYYYTRFVPLPLDDYLDLIDVVTLWGSTSDIPNLEQTLVQLEKQIPGKRVMLGLYMFDYGTRQPLPVDMMQLQCETGLRWLRDGRVEGLIFLGNTVMDLDFPSVEWSRRWVAEISDQKL